MAQAGYTPIQLYYSLSASSTPLAINLASGELAINATDGKLFYKDNANVVQVIGWKTTPATAGGTGQTTYTTGDLLYASATNTLSKRSVGSNGQVLTVVAGVPAWANAAGGGVTSFQTSLSGLTPSTATTGVVTLAGTLGATSGGTSFSTYATGDIIYASASNTLSKLTAGTNGFVLTLASGVPTWAASSGGVASFSAGTTGLTPSTATTGAIVLAGTLATANGGTGLGGATPFTNSGIVYASSTSALTTGTALTFDGTTFTLGGTGKRISGDMSNATIANRVSFQTSTTNGNTAVSAIPNGTSTTTNFSAYNNSDPTNASLLAVGALSADTRIQSAITGTGTYLPMTFYTGGSERLRLDTSGNLGLGVTPSPWGAASEPLQAGPVAAFFGTANNTGVSNNAYFNGSNYGYLSTSAASLYLQAGGVHTWYDAVSGLVNTTGIVSSQTYLVFSLGSTTLGQWQAFFSALVALPTVGQSIVATASGTLLGGGTVTDAVAFVANMTLDASGRLLLGNATAPSSAVVRQAITGGTSNYTQYTSTAGAGVTLGNISGALQVSTFTGALGSETYTERIRVTANGGVSFGATGTAYGTSGQVLTSGGDVPPTWTTIGGLTGFTAALNIAAPNATVNVSSLLASGGTTNQHAAFIPKGTGSILAAIPDSVAAGGNVRGTYSVDLQLSRSAAASVVAGDYSAILAGNNNAIAASMTASAIISGINNAMTGSYGAIIGGDTNTITTAGAAVLSSSIISGVGNSLTRSYSTVINGRYGTNHATFGTLVIPSAYNYGATTLGAQQSAHYIMGIETTNATATRLTTTGGVSDINNVPVINNNGAAYFKGRVIANVTGAGNSKVWTFEGGLKRGATAATTVLIGSVAINIVAADAGASTWVIAVTADNTNGGLNVTVTGQAATTIRWNCQVQTVEMSF